MTGPLQIQTQGEIDGTGRVAITDWESVPSTWTATLVDTNGTDDPGDATETPPSPEECFISQADDCKRDKSGVAPFFLK